MRATLDDGTVLVADLEVARTFRARSLGLLGRRGLPEGHGLLIPRCGSVHMFGMRFAIDVVFLDDEGVVVKVVENLRPWRMAVSSGTQALELPAGTVARIAPGLGSGDRIRFDGPELRA